ncbi:MAG: RNA methyltransferase [Bacteroidia bacterium]|nr:RNA methyltransferase [Bacteroidia bacterium]
MRKLTLDELGRMSVDAFRAAEKLPLVVVLDNVRSLMNVGSVFRTADAFLVGRLYLCGLTGTPPHREIEKTALGSTHSVAWAHHASTLALVQDLKTEGYHIVALEQTAGSVPLAQYSPPMGGPVALVLGNEISGVDGGVLAEAHAAVEIPQYGTKHSLNVAVAAGIGIYHVAELLRARGVGLG